MSNIPQIAVVILTYNTKELLQRFLPPLIDSCKGLAEVWVADNDSNDGSFEYLESVSGLNLIRLDKNYGYAGGYNRALKQINADFFVLVNSDIEITDNWLPNLLRPIIENRDIAAVQPKILSLKDRNTFEYAGAGGGLLDKWAYPFCRGRLFDALEEDHGQYNDQSEIFWASGACFVIRAELFHAAAGFDENFFAHMEEIDLCWRLQHMGYKIWYTAKSTVYHVGGGTLKTGSYHKYFLNYRNNLAMITKNYKGRSWFLLILWKMVLDGVSAINFLFGGRADVFNAVITAHVAYWSKLGYWINVRRSLRRTRSNTILYPKSVVWAYFALRKRKFSDL